MTIETILPVPSNPVNEQINELDDIFAGDISSSLNTRKSLFDLINVVSPKKYSVSIADFINPTRAPDYSRKNTRIIMFEVPNLGLFNPRYVWYNRIHTSVFGVIILPKNNAFKVSDLIIDINATLNSSILQSELDDFVLPPPDVNGRVSFELLFNNTSFRYYSGPKVIIGPVENGQPITKQSLGLEKVDNTSDLEKPLSTAQLQANVNIRISLEQYVSQYVSAQIANVSTSLPVWNMREW